MSECDVDRLLDAINEVGKKADNAVLNTVRIEGKLKGHHKYISECYKFRDDQIDLNKQISDHILIDEEKNRHDGRERRKKALVVDRVLKIFTIVISLIVAVFVGLKTF